MSTVKIPITISADGHPTIPVTISNGNKKVTVNMIVDTGWEQNHLESKYSRLLGYTAADILVKEPNQNKYRATVQIGSLKPLTTLLNIATGTVNLNVFGALWMRQFDSFIITKSSVTATDSTTGGNTMKGVAELTKDWYKYVHAIVGGPMLAATKKQALFAAGRSNSGAYWRNRM